MQTSTFQTIKADPLQENDRLRIADYIESTAGIQMPASKKTLIESRLRKRQRALSFETLKSYIAFVFETPDGQKERLHLLDALTTNKTEFYREAQHFEFLRSHLRNNYGTQGREIRLWSAGCSSGEEAYTLSIEMLEFQREFPQFSFSVNATDISASCIEHARRAVYHHDKIEPVDMVLRRRYLLRSRNKSDNSVKMAPEVMAPVNFDFFNLINGDWNTYHNQFSIIFCRNVMIYFNQEDRARLTQRFHQSLVEGGLLFIGHSETLLDPHGLFVRLRPTIYLKKTKYGR
ncbi:chemotaxis protein [Aestuariibacter sp. GS-14]|uniref:CheR family methyltransferase n=1 Tax=Aestuariibacter sp. GS-14 TaxID=2590670 RepID=UPI0011276193|nr:CheR family methyltransferase [Aestuariibacter sp. GS-14]TPV57345.1 chemotaxis protein [Aestuariibacter sp. GS-14]